MNDHSDDNTSYIAEKFIGQLKNLQIINLQDGIAGKKLAIATAIDKSKGELIITLDADCRVNVTWLSTITAFYCHFRPRLIIGPVIYNDEKNLFDYMQSLEILGLVASGAGASALGKPILCNGANLAFSKDTYLQVSSDPNTNIASGDDLFLLLSVKQRWPKEIRFIKSSMATVYTKAEPDFRSFLLQRKRWTSKSRHYKDKDILVVAIVVFLGNLAICTSFILTFLIPKMILLYLTLVMLKSLADLPLMYSFAGFFDKRHILRYFWLTQLFYPFYIIFMTIYGNIGKFEWKSRIYK